MALYSVERLTGRICGRSLAGAGVFIVRTRGSESSAAIFSRNGGSDSDSADFDGGGGPWRPRCGGPNTRSRRIAIPRTILPIDAHFFHWFERLPPATRAFCEGALEMGSSESRALFRRSKSVRISAAN